ncbi:MAG: TerC family protein [Elusimicrobiota bacterium]
MNLTWLWAGFVLVMGTMLAVALGVLQKKAHPMRMREAAVMTSLWVLLATCFGVVIFWAHGHDKAMQFFAGYILEQSLSVDNLFVFILIFHYFRVPPEYQPRILHWGILGAIVMRFFFLFAGLSLLQRFSFMFYVFGGILLWTGGKMLLSGEDDAPEPGKNPALRLLHRFLPVTEGLHGQVFFTRVGERLSATPLFAALVVIEASDLVFAVDSIPAALGVTNDLFVVYTSNIFAVMGLRSMYFLLAGSMMKFAHLKTGVSVVLCFVGLKMVVKDFFHVSTGISLAVIAGVLALSVAASLINARAKS